MDRLPEADVRRLIAVGTPGEVKERVLDAASRGASAWASLFLPGPLAIEEQLVWFADAVIRPARAELAQHASANTR